MKFRAEDLKRLVTKNQKCLGRRDDREGWKGKRKFLNPLINQEGDYLRTAWIIITPFPRCDEVKLLQFFRLFSLYYWSALNFEPRLEKRNAVWNTYLLNPKTHETMWCMVVRSCASWISPLFSVFAHFPCVLPFFSPYLICLSHFHIHVFLDLPLFLFPSSFASYTFLTGLSSPILTTCPSDLNCPRYVVISIYSTFSWSLCTSFLILFNLVFLFFLGISFLSCSFCFCHPFERKDKAVSHPGHFFRSGIELCLTPLQEAVVRVSLGFVSREVTRWSSVWSTVRLSLVVRVH